MAMMLLGTFGELMAFRGYFNFQDLGGLSRNFVETFSAAMPFFRIKHGNHMSTCTS